MRIAFITASLGLGGAEKMISFVANRLNKRGHRVLILNLKEVDDRVIQEIDADITILDVPREKKGIAKRIQQYIYLKRSVRLFQADVIIGFTLFPNFYASCIGRRLSIPSIISERGDPSRTIGNNPSLKESVLLKVINHASGAVFQTDGAASFYALQLQKNGVVIPNPIEEQKDFQYEDIPIRDKTVVSCGRFDNFQKRYDVMIKGFSLFHKLHPEYKLRLYGEGPDEGSIRKTCESLNIDKCVQFKGMTNSSMKDMAHDGMFVITSDYEGIPNVLLEAMAAGLPVISTDCTPGGARLLIRNRENGILVKRDNPEEVAEAMSYYAEHPDDAVQFGREARKVLNDYSPDRIIDRWEDFLTEIVSKK